MCLFEFETLKTNNVILKKDTIVWKIINVLEWTTDYFKKHGIDEARLKAELLLADVLKCNRLQLYQFFDKPLTKIELSKYKKYIKRAVQNEPVQMIIGKVPFINLELFVSPVSIVPRPETEFLTAMIIEQNSNKKNMRILDIGTGTGCIALSLAKAFPDSEIIAVDVSDESLELAKTNQSHNNISNVTFYHNDILNEKIDEKYNLIVSNPPYIPLDEYRELQPEVKNWEPADALTDREQGLTFYHRFAKIFPENLNTDGVFYLEIGSGQAKSISNIFKSEIFTINFLEDLNHIQRFVQGRINY